MPYCIDVHTRYTNFRKSTVLYAFEDDLNNLVLEHCTKNRTSSYSILEPNDNNIDIEGYNKHIT